MQEHVIALEAAFDLDDEEPLSNPKKTLKPALDVPQTIPERINRPYFCASNRMIAQEETRRIYVF